VQQHPETIDRPQPTRAGLPQQRRLERRVDDIGHHGLRRQGGEIEHEVALPCHAERGGVDEQARAGEEALRLVEAARLDPLAEGGAQCGGAVEAAVDHLDAADAALDQAKYDGTRRAARPQHHRGVEPAVPARSRGVEIGDEALDVRIRGPQHPAVEPERVGGADRARPRIRVGQLQRRLLVRQRDIGADIAALRQTADEVRKGPGRHRLAAILGREPELPDPVVMDQWRARMLDRPADHARGPGCRLRSCEVLHHA
jgi:hypothetical protein